MNGNNRRYYVKDLWVSLRASAKATLAPYGTMAWDEGSMGSNGDSDGDGLSDSIENAGWYIWLCTSGTTWHHIKVWSDPNNPDTDGDYVSDEAEYDHGTNPQDEDTDNDALDDRQEIYYYGTYGYTWDSDEDGISDYTEVNVIHYNPISKDSDGDGIFDGNEDYDGDGIRNINDWEISKYNRRFGFIFEIARSHDPPLNPLEGLTVANSLGDLNFDGVWLISDNEYTQGDCRFNGKLKNYEKNQITKATFRENLNDFVNEYNIGNPGRGYGGDLVIVYMTSHGRKSGGTYYFSLANNGEINEGEIHDLLSLLGDTLVLLWISTCYSAYSFDQWSSEDNIIVIGNSYLNDAGAGKWMAAYTGGDDIGFSEGASIEEAFYFADEVESGHDLEIEDYYPGSLYFT